MLAMFNAAALEMRSNAEANGLVIRIDMMFPMHGYQLGAKKPARDTGQAHSWRASPEEEHQGARGGK
jgi:hypothetical protein